MGLLAASERTLPAAPGSPCCGFLSRSRDWSRRSCRATTAKRQAISSCVAATVVLPADGAGVATAAAAVAGAAGAVTGVVVRDASGGRAGRNTDGVGNPGVVELAGRVPPLSAPPPPPSCVPPLTARVVRIAPPPAFTLLMCPLRSRPGGLSLPAPAGVPAWRGRHGPPPPAPPGGTPRS